MKKLHKIYLMLISSVFISTGLFAQAIPTLELTRPATPTNFGFGTSVLPMTGTFQLDAVNDNNFVANSETITATISFQNQVFNSLGYGSGITTQNTGMVFGASPTTGSSSTLGPAARNRYDILGAYTGSYGPTDLMYTSNPTATGAQLGTGIKVSNVPANTNGGFEVFTTSYPLYKDTVTYPLGSRVYFGQIKITFSQAVLNPVIHLAGLGGSLRYSIIGQPINDPASWRSTFFSTELELQTPGVTTTILSGNSFFSLSGNNILNNNNANPNGASVNDATNPTPPSFNEFGAASGSVRINGFVQELVYNVYLEGGTASQYAWGVDKSKILGAITDPFPGDIWYVSASLDKPVLQVISGSVFNDADGLADNNIAETFTSVGAVTNPKTNAGGVYANLLIAGNLVVASVPIGANGVYLFENVPVGTYTVQLTTNPSAGTYTTPAVAPATVLPAGWVNTGEFNGTGTGNDGSANGISAPIIVLPGDVKTNNNFGIERLPDSKSFLTVITTPPFNATITLNTPGVAPYGNLPILSGSDPEDQITEGVLTGKSVRFTTLATVGTNNAAAVLRYNGVVITLNQTIPNFNPALLTVSLPNAWTGTGLKFNYAYVDAAGFADPTPALYRLVWSGGGPLVINLSEFNAVKNNCTANLNWKTSTEINGDRFEVQISTSTNPVYTTVGSVLATGNSSTPKSYQYSFNMQSGVIYYFRLKMIDKDGSFTYSDTRSLNCSNGKTGVVIAPNPVFDIFKVWGMENGKNIVAVYAANGQLVKTQVIAQNQGEVNVSHLAPGMYTVKVTSENGNTVISKLIKY